MQSWVKVLVVSFVGFGAGFGVIAVTLRKSDNSAQAAGDEKGKKKDGKPVEVDWSTLRELDSKTGKMTDNVKVIDGALVRVPGFMIPLEDNQQQVTEFLLVPSPMACIHVPPPPPNQIIHVKMASGNPAKMSYGPVWVQGRLKVAEAQGPYGKTSYEMVGELTEPYM